MYFTYCKSQIHNNVHYNTPCNLTVTVHIRLHFFTLYIQYLLTGVRTFGLLLIVFVTCEHLCLLICHFWLQLLLWPRERWTILFGMAGYCMVPESPNICYEVVRKTSIEEDFAFVVADLLENKIKAWRIVVYCQSLNMCASLYEHFNYTLNSSGTNWFGLERETIIFIAKP